MAHGTPLVVLCEETIQARARALRQAVGDGRVFFGTKALPNVAVLRLLLSEGIGADVASSGELAFARNAGLGGGDLVVHGNNKAEVLLAEAASVGAPVVLDAPDEPALAKAIVQLAQHLGMQTIAEGVEDAVQVDALRALGCGYAQGFHFSRPLAGDEFATLLGARAAGRLGCEPEDVAVRR